MASAVIIKILKHYYKQLSAGGVHSAEMTQTFGIFSTITSRITATTFLFNREARHYGE